MFVDSDKKCCLLKSRLPLNGAPRELRCWNATAPPLRIFLGLPRSRSRAQVRGDVGPQRASRSAGSGTFTIS